MDEVVISNPVILCTMTSDALVVLDKLLSKVKHVAPLQEFLTCTAPTVLYITVCSYCTVHYCMRSYCTVGRRTLSPSPASPSAWG